MKLLSSLQWIKPLAFTCVQDCVMMALREKTVILVTHQVEFLSQVDTILVMEGGKITQSGNYDNLLTSGTAFEKLVSAHEEAITELEQSNEIKTHTEESQDFYVAKNESEEEISTEGQLEAQLTQEEEKEKGDVVWKTFWDYISFSKVSFMLCWIILAQSAFVALQTASMFWLALAIEVPKLTSATLIGVDSLISFAISLWRSPWNKSFYSLLPKFTSAIFNAPMLFFDSTPVGRILSRASADLSILNFDIPYSITFVVSVAIDIVVTIYIMVLVTWPVLIVAIPAMVASKYVQGYYQASSRELMRINGTTKAPVMNFAAETSLGVVTVRAFNMAERFFKNYLKLVDTDATLFFHSNVAMEWLVLRIEALQNLTVITSALLLILVPQGYVTSGLVGLSLSYAFSLTGSQIFWTRWYCNLLNYIISVERIKQFIHLPAEPPAIVQDHRPPSSWPSKGRIDLHALEIRYRPNAPLVLKGITCTFKEGSRVGVVGRTGNGKSTLISALFRLVEPAKGYILIDGINICSMGLKDLRMKLSIIPQEPTLFRGSIRTNSDDDIWKTLQKGGQTIPIQAPKMAYFGKTIDDFSWTCLKDFEFTSFCSQRTTIDTINLLFVCFFYTSMIISIIRRCSISCSFRTKWTFLVASICCAIISIAFYSIGLWILIVKTDNTKQLSWVACVVRGFVWTSLAVSLLVQREKWIKILNCAWWTCSCVLVSSLIIEILLRKHAIEIFDIVQWLTHFLLLFCAFQNLCYYVSQSLPESLSEPLLAQEVDTKQTELGHSTFLSKLTFSWVNSLLRLGYSKPLALEDIPSLLSEDEAEFAYQNFMHTWESLVRESSKDNTKNLVLWSVVRTHLKENILIAFYALLRTIAVTVSPLILYAFVNYSNSRDAKQTNLKEGLSIVGFLILSRVVDSVSQRHWFFDSRRSGLKIRSALMVAVYKKQLKLSSSARRRHSTGEIVNYIAVDTYRMGEFPWWFHISWTSAVQLVLSVGVLFGVVGVGALPGLVPLVICGLINVPFAKILQHCMAQFMISQDERLRSTSEILNSMKIIKLQSWEDKFKNLVENLRAKEFIWLSKSQMMKSYGTFLYWMSPTIVSAVVFLGCALFNSAPLNAGTIFTVFATLRNLSEPVRMIPEALSMMIQVKVSFDRLNTVLLDEELDSSNANRRNINQSSVNAVEIQAGNFIWDHESVFPTLRDVNLQIEQGQKIAVCGPVGAGKSSLLFAVLGEFPKISGTVNVSGTVAYVSQTSWIQSGTVRDNILFGKPMDKTRYDDAIKVCALDKDINDFSHGDLTEIGQRGINMSGGQKQRIQLARAVYNDADIYLLDDPFSAVDAHTAAILFNDCVMMALREKTVILVTHQVEFLSQVDTILVMEGGKVTQAGNYVNLLTSGTAFEQLVSAHKEAISELEQNNENKTHTEESQVRGRFLTRVNLGYSLHKKKKKRLVMCSMMLCWIILGQFAFVVLQAASTFWLVQAIEIPKLSSVTLIGVYSLISFGGTVFAFLRTSIGAHLGLKASTAFFSSFTTSIFNAPMLFFDSTPVGRILTRASSDLTILDFDIPFSITFVASVPIEILMIIGIMVYVTWQVLIVAVPAMVASKYVQGYYQASARELIRINGTTKAPVMNFAAETSLGLVTVRAFNMADRFFKNYLKLVDTDAALFFYSNAAMEWLVLRIETLQNLTVITAALLLVLVPQGYVSPGLVGLSLSYTFTLTGTQIFLTRWYCNLLNYIISVERIKQFIQLPEEPPAIIRYRPNAPLVLKGITCTFKEGSRVGVVGRTGSGKSTLISALFRLVEPASGDILIDGINICSIGLKDLKIKLSIIPQEPTLFKGSIRTNLDPLGLYSDDDLWKALEKCQLKETISRLPNLLDSLVSDEGGNWSLGQRQLFCLGRVLLKRNRILVLDEATASIDSATDAILQQIIRQEFAKCTVITVAHRVPTVIDSDMVMVLSYGKLVEYDEPSKLMDTNSSFSKLVAEYWSSCRKNSPQTLAGSNIE
ncbi:ABC transporter C family member 8 [Glycine max]|nr:ABC transporter C family member 8 [Glycine max]